MLSFASYVKNIDISAENFAKKKKSRIFAVPFGEIVLVERDLRRKSEGLFIGVWRSWLAHLVWDQRVLCSSHSTPTKKDC